MIDKVSKFPENGVKIIPHITIPVLLWWVILPPTGSKTKVPQVQGIILAFLNIFEGMLFSYRVDIFHNYPRVVMKNNQHV